MVGLVDVVHVVHVDVGGWACSRPPGRPFWKPCYAELAHKSLCIYTLDSSLEDALERLRMAELLSRADPSEGAGAEVCITTRPRSFAAVMAPPFPATSCLWSLNELIPYFVLLLLFELLL